MPDNKLAKRGDVAVVKRKRGGQLANVNARTVGLYTDALTPEEQNDLAILAAKPDMLEEIALLRLVMRRAVISGAALEAIAAGIDSLGRALKVNRSLSGEMMREFERSLSNMVNQLCDELEITG